MPKKALIVVDIQNDFLPPEGALAVPYADEVIAPINRLVQLPFDQVVATKDFHPEGHISFASRWEKEPFSKHVIHGKEEVRWPDHCVMGTQGAEFPETLRSQYFHKIIHKGQNKEVDSYSCFFDNECHFETELEDYLKDKEIEQIFLAGLTRDYCVYFSALDALDLGFTVYVILDATHGIDEKRCASLMKGIEEKGGSLITMREVETLFSARLVSS